MTDAYYAALFTSLGLTKNDLCEIAGVSSRWALEIIKGKAPFHEDVREALEQLDDDSGVMMDEIIADVQEGAGAIFIFRTNEELRGYFPDWPARGQARGGFIGPHRIAALAAAEQLASDGIDVDIQYLPR